MGRSKRGKKSKRPGSDEEDAIRDEGPDPESDDFFHDDVDKFNLNREKLLLDVEGDDSEDEDSIEEEEIMGLDLPESVDDDDDEEENDEDEDSEEETKLPSNKSWGKKKASFYSADATEQEIGSDEEAWEMEKEEEVEAMALQQRMAAGLDEEDFDTTNYQIPQEDDTEDRLLEDEEIDKTVVMDLTKLSKEQKLEMLFRDSPELFELLDQFKVKLQELVSQISPLMQLSKLGKVSAEGSKYIELRYKLYLNYCINIAFYLLLKSKQTPVKDHPVIARIVQYRNLIKELEPIDKNLESDINFLLDNKDMLLQQSESTFEITTTTSRNTAKAENSKEKKKAKKSKAKLSDLLNDSDEDETEERDVQPPPKKSKNSASSNNTDSENPLDYYEKVRLEKEKAKEIKDLAARLMHEPHLELEDLDVNEEGKRAITYQISKNKGLTAKKKKEDRNPRVKHRKKYSKAIVKRKSQVRPVVNETTRYDGEKSGIRAFLTRSIKIK